MAATTGGETLNEIKTRVQELETQEASTKEQLREAEEAVAEDPNDADAKRRVAMFRQMLLALDVSLLTLRDTYKDVYEMAQEAAMRTAVISGPPIRLVAPPPFAIGHDFEVFAAQLTNYVGNVPFSLQMQTLKSLLAADAFKACRSTLDASRKTNLQSVLAEIRPLLEPRRTLAARVNEFHSCTQRPDESLAKFAARIRHLGELAYPDVANPEPYLIQQFVRGAHANSIQKNIVSSHACGTLNDALNKVAEVVNVNDLNAEVFEVARVSERRNSKGDQRCYRCNRTGHVQSQCYAWIPREGNAKGPRKEMAERPRCQLCAQVGHVATACKSVKVVPNRTSATAFRFNEQKSSNSGARQQQPCSGKAVPNKKTSNSGQAGVLKNARGLSQ